MLDTEQDVKNLLHNVTADLTPDVTALVRQGRSQGQRLRRHRNRTVTIGVAAVVAVAATGVSLLAQFNATQQDMTSLTKPTAVNREQTEQPAATSTPPTRRRLAVQPADIPATFARLYPGDVTLQSQKESGIPIVDFLWNGFSIRVGFAKAEYHAANQNVDPNTGDIRFGNWKAAGTPLERCLRATDHPSDCHLTVDGFAVRRLHDTTMKSIGGPSLNWAWVYTPDGWDIWLSAANAADTKSGPTLAPEVPLTTLQVLRAAQSDVWFQHA
jgi:hypothetical protein